MKSKIALILTVLLAMIPSLALGSSMEYCLISNRSLYLPVVEKPAYPDPDKTAYLTFDDGPSKVITPQVLDILKEHNIKATFFTIGKHMENNPELVQRIVNEGHALGNHSYSHDYNIVYSGLENFEWEVNTWSQIARDILGHEYNVNVFRFPGGSHTKSKLYKDYIVEMGYGYHDWNALNGDSEMKVISEDYLLRRTKETVKGQDELIFLMHDADGKQNTVDTLSDVIHLLRLKGYGFEILK